MKISLFTALIIIAFATNSLAAVATKTARKSTAVVSHKKVKARKTTKLKSGKHTSHLIPAGKNAIKDKADVNRVALKTCVDTINSKFLNLRKQHETACADEALATCAVLKGRISALQSQIKDCRKTAATTAPSATAPGSAVVK